MVARLAINSISVWRHVERRLDGDWGWGAGGLKGAAGAAKTGLKTPPPPTALPAPKGAGENMRSTGKPPFSGSRIAEWEQWEI